MDCTRPCFRYTNKEFSAADVGTVVNRTCNFQYGWLRETSSTLILCLECSCHILLIDIQPESSFVNFAEFSFSNFIFLSANRKSVIWSLMVRIMDWRDFFSLNSASSSVHPSIVRPWQCFYSFCEFYIMKYNKSTKELSLFHELKFSNHYIFVTWCCKPLIFQT